MIHYKNLNLNVFKSARSQTLRNSIKEKETTKTQPKPVPKVSKLFDIQTRERLTKNDKSRRSGYLSPIISPRNIYYSKNIQKTNRNYSKSLRSSLGFKSAGRNYDNYSRFSSAKGSKKSNSSHSSFRRINKRLKDLNRSIDKSLSSHSSKRSYHYNERKIAVKSSSLQQKPMSSQRCNPEFLKYIDNSRNTKMRRKESSVLDVINHITLKYNNVYVATETQDKLKKLYEVNNQF